jgi:hypothetical protein
MCDVKGCIRPPYAEIYRREPFWSFLCKKHYYEERDKVLTGKLTVFGFCELSLSERIRFFYCVFHYIKRELRLLYERRMH